MRKKWTYWRRAVISLLCVISCLPWGQLPAAAEPDMPEVLEETWKQNDGLLVPANEPAQPDTPEVTDDEAEESLRGAGSLPSFYSLLDVDGSSYVTSVKDQGSTGLCWAYAALGACESNIMKQGLDIPESWKDSSGELNFSEAALGWYPFTNHLLVGDLTSGDYITMDNKGISGGNPTIAGYGLAAGIGPQLEQFASMDDWSQGYSEYQRYNAYYRMQSSDLLQQVDTAGRTVIKQWLMESGAVSASFYSKGIFFDNGDSIAYYQKRHGTGDADHAVLLVGWDDNYSRENFQKSCQPKSDGAWLVRNSWGADDVGGGYFWLSYEEASLCEAARFQMTQDSTPVARYQYDGSVSYANVNFSAAANVFTAEKSGRLTEVMFPMTSNNSQGGWYTISVYRLKNNAQSPVDGTKLCSKQGTVQYGGYKNISLAAQNVMLQKGDRFSVVLELRKEKGSREKLWLSFESNSTETLERHCSIQSGQTFICSGDTWIDMVDVKQWENSSGKKPYSNLGNAAIKAIVREQDAAVNWAQWNAAMSYGEPAADADPLYQAAYAEAAALPEDATQAEVDNAAANLFAGLEREGLVQYSQYIYAKETAEPLFLLGDVDGNGSVDATDVFQSLLAQAQDAVGYASGLSMSQAAAADCDGNSKIDATDAFYLMLYCAYRGAGIPKSWDEILST